MESYHTIFNRTENVVPQNVNVTFRPFSESATNLDAWKIQSNSHAASNLDTSTPFPFDLMDVFNGSVLLS